MKREREGGEEVKKKRWRRRKTTAPCAMHQWMPLFLCCLSGLRVLLPVGGGHVPSLRENKSETEKREEKREVDRREKAPSIWLDRQ